MHATVLTMTDLTTLQNLVATANGPGIVVWCLEHGGFSDAADPSLLRWISPDGTADIAIGAEHGFDRQVLRLGEAILASPGMLTTAASEAHAKHGAWASCA